LFAQLSGNGVVVGCLAFQVGDRLEADAGLVQEARGGLSAALLAAVGAVSCADTSWLYELYNPTSYDDACALEVELAIDFREAGYGVWQAW